MVRTAPALQAVRACLLHAWLALTLARNAQLYPNTFWNRYGSWFSLTNVTPISADSCLTTFDIFFKPSTLGDAAFVEQCLKAEDELQREDIDLCIKVSENLRNPLYNAGRYAPIEVRSDERAALCRTARLLTAPACSALFCQQAPMWWWHQKLHKDVFGSAPGLKHRPVGSNRSFYTLE
jgi:hypothetical protein